MTIRGLDPRFILGTYYSQSQRTAWQIESEKVEFVVKDQYSEKYLRKLGNRYTNKFQIFDFTETEKTALLAMNATTQPFYQHYDTIISGAVAYRTVYCDIYFNELKYYPKSVIEVTLTDRDVIDESTNSYAASGLVNWDGYVAPNGTDQYATLPITNLGNTFSIAFAYKEWAVSTLRYPVLCSNTNYFQLGSDTFNTNRLVFRAGTNSNQAFYSTVDKLSISSSTWHTAVVAVNISANTVKMYFDGVEDTGVAGAGGTLADETYALLQLFKANIYFNNMKTKHIVITSDEMTATDALNHYNTSISSIDNQIAWYKCDDESGDLIDSANSNDATVYSADAAFYNGDYLYKWYIQENIQYDTPYPKFVMGASSYIFDSLECKVTEPIEFSINNVIDWQDTSITGRLHRDYALDADGNIKQEIKYIIRKDNLERADYDLLKIYDGKTIKFYPNNDEAEYYDADVSMEFLNLNNLIFCDYVEIEIICRGVRLT